VAEECRFIFRSKVINPKWIDGLKRHGYRGASELAHMTEYLIGWDGTSDSIDDWMYDAVVDKILMDDGTREWLLSENPHAMMTMLDRLSEAIDRELWNASDDMMEKIRNLYMESEARVEELMDCGRNDPAIRDGR